MKKLFLFAVLSTFIFFNAQAQDALKAASSAASAGGFDVKSLTSSIMGKLGPALNLTGTEKPALQVR
jgi:hypothetical protein